MNIREPRLLRDYLEMGERLLAGPLTAQEREILERRLMDFKAIIDLHTDVSQPLNLSWPELLRVVIPYVDTVCTLRAGSEAAGKRIKTTEMKRTQAIGRVKAQETTPDKAALCAQIKAHDKGRKPGTEAALMLRDEAFCKEFPTMKVDALTRRIKKIRTSD